MKLVTMTGELARRFGIERALEMIKEAGFDGYDYTMSGSEWPILTEAGYEEHLAKINAKAKELNLPCLQAHTPCPKTPETISTADYVKMQKHALKCAAALGCPIAVVHPGNSLSAEENVELIYTELVSYASELGIKVATENMFNWRNGYREIVTVPAACGTSSDFIKHIDLLPSEYFTACLDIGHAQMVNCEGAVKMIHALGKERIGALHVHDNDLYHDYHTLPFVGYSDWNEICAALKDIGYSGHFTFETDYFIKNYPDELLPYCLKLLEQTGRYLSARSMT